MKTANLCSKSLAQNAMVQKNIQATFALTHHLSVNDLKFAK